MHKRSSINIAVAAALLASASQAHAATQGNALTIYSTSRPGAVSPGLLRDSGSGQNVPGFAIVRHERALDLIRGVNTVRYTDVAALIDPTTVSFESLTDPAGTSIMEQNFQFDLVSTQRLLQKYIDRNVSVDQVRGSGVESFTGTLLSVTGGLTLKRSDGSIQILPHNAGIRLPELPGGLITRPTLVWDIEARRAGSHRSRVSYETGGLTWWADYNVTYAEGSNANACKLDIGAWVSIVNRSGASYPDAKLKLVAGDVQRATAPGRAELPAAARSMAMEDRAAGFAEKAFFEYHLYTLGRTTTLPDNSTKQIELFPAARNVPCEKTLVYFGQMPGWRSPGNPITDRNYGIATNKKVDVYLKFKNAAENNMGMPLPSGRMRVNKLDGADGALEFIGEDTIDHTAKNEQVLVKLGSAFDVVGERRQLHFTVDSSRRTMTEEIEIRLRNHKSGPVAVVVKENLYRWTNWQVTQKSHDFRKEDARTIHFPVRVPADGETVVRYTVQYTW